MAVHRGGVLSVEHHRLLALWAADCAEHILTFFKTKDERPWTAVKAARAWTIGEISVGEARKAAVNAHAAARESSELAQVYVARAAGHAVATAHMADHAPGAAVYAIKALRAAEHTEASIQQEHKWQKDHLPEEIKALVLSTFKEKFAYLNL